MLRPGNIGCEKMFGRLKAFAVQRAVLVMLVCCGVVGLGEAGNALAEVVVAKVSLKQQRMRVFINGKRKFTWRVSTGKKGWETRRARYKPFALTPYYYSDKWKMKLPFLVSISDDGIAIHGTTRTSRLGRPVSHGCIRLSIPNAKVFYNLVSKHGMWNTEVIVSR